MKEVHAQNIAFHRRVVLVAAAPLWNDSGLGGKSGSLWRSADAAKLMVATPGHAPPTGVLQLRKPEFRVDEFALPSESAGDE